MQSTTASWRQIVGVAKFSIFGATFIMAVAMSTSYMTQVLFFLVHHVGWASWAVPATIDVLALMSNLALALPPRAGYGRGGLWFIFIVTLSFSMVLNLLAGENFIASTAHGWVVVAYLAAEYVRGWVKRYRAALEDEGEQTTIPRVTPVEPVRVTPEPVQEAQRVVAAEVTRLPVPVSPAPTRVTPEADRTPIRAREVISPLTGRVLTQRPPQK